MNLAIKQQWVQALRSGEFKRCVGMLSNGRGGYCASGVLCELHRRTTGGKWQRGGDEGLPDQRAYIRNTIGCPKEVREWAELGAIADLRVQYINDKWGAKFPQIADYIEEKL